MRQYVLEAAVDTRHLTQGRQSLCFRSGLSRLQWLTKGLAFPSPGLSQSGTLNLDLFGF